ncbi:MAG: homoserine dehydrogenase [Candidatus Saganbacteria bacterium]|uniref:Homoserine dehydrogenase n=1 Tax=Candidatus Saganbacteria bacterium TaxID=2575572 RepID=A0A833L1J4_UNCSA|nr:MAG: homoserine dehydrogenase [Candidatus Saganbacteria bacterium]
MLINIGLLGFGVVGSAVEKLVKLNSAVIEKNTGLNLKIKGIADNDSGKKHHLLTKNAYDVINDPEISVIVEAIGGEKPALEFILAAIDAGKHVVTSNKVVIALHLNKILERAKAKGVNVLFEASVGGGIPIIGPLSNDLAANQITEVYGIVNGTTNYILSKMKEMEFEEALKDAQKMGYAEADPKLDIEGFDASYKAAILASVAFKAEIDWKKINFEGISAIMQEDIRYAGDMGYAIKLLAIAKNIDDEIDIRVHPTLVSKIHPLANIDGAMNAIYVKGNAVGELMFYGQGAGGMATASAVVGDVVKCVKNQSENSFSLMPAKIKDSSVIASRYYIRLAALDKSGVLAGISTVFADENVSIATVVQKETIGKVATIVIVIHETKDADLRKAIAKLKKLPTIKKVCSVIRVGL